MNRRSFLRRVAGLAALACVPVRWAKSKVKRYAGCWLVIPGRDGKDRCRQITAYNPTIRTITIDGNWEVPPHGTSTLTIVDT